MEKDRELKMYYSIREVAERIGIPEHTLRFWEKEIPSLNPKKTHTGIRQYTEDDIELIRLIHHLVKEQGLTVKAANKRLKISKRKVMDNQEIIDRLKTIRDELAKIKSKLDEMAPFLD
ncbi:MAG: MerR family transcriptional regulator [Bacteroidales bacterium]|nr:MerR family transcriptional regulator [Bacteroidales bacterium]